jgi:hypothetical protein
VGTRRRTAPSDELSPREHQHHVGRAGDTIGVRAFSLDPEDEDEEGSLEDL